MAIDLSAAVGFYVALIAIINPVGTVPLFLEAVSEDPVDVQKTVAKLFAAAILCILLFFYFTGQPFLKAFGITIPAFRITGGILVMMIGIRMMNGKQKFDNETLDTRNSNSNNTFKEAKERLSNIVVPLGIPIYIGPGALTTVILFSQQAHGIVNHTLMLLSLVAVCATIGGVLYLSRWFAKIFGPNGMQIITRVMGLILCAMAVQFVIDGIAQLLPGVLNSVYTHVAPNA